MKITISKKQKLEFIPEVEDKKATAAKRESVPPDERDAVESVLVPADYALFFWPLTLSAEEDVIDKIQKAYRDAEGNVKPHPSLVNDTFAKHICGWRGIFEDEEQKTPFEFDTAWENGKIPDDVVQAFDRDVRGAAFGFLVEQAGMGAEKAVGKPE